MPLATSAPIPIAPIGQGRNFGVHSYQTKTSLSDRPGVLVPALRRSSTALRKASYAERDRLRSIDPGIVDFADEDEEDDDDDDLDLTDGANAQLGGRARRQALKILQARDSVPAAGEFSSSHFFLHAVLIFYCDKGCGEVLRNLLSEETLELRVYDLRLCITLIISFSLATNFFTLSSWFKNRQCMICFLVAVSRTIFAPVLVLSTNLPNHHHSSSTIPSPNALVTHRNHSPKLSPPLTSHSSPSQSH